MPKLSTIPFVSAFSTTSLVSALPRAIIGGFTGTVVSRVPCTRDDWPSDGHCGGARDIHGARHSGRYGHAFPARHLRFCNRVCNCRSVPAGSGLVARCYFLGGNLVLGRSDRHASPWCRIVFRRSQRSRGSAPRACCARCYPGHGHTAARPTHAVPAVMTCVNTPRVVILDGGFTGLSVLD